MKNSVIAIQSFVITTIVYALLAPIFFEMDNLFGAENVVDGNTDKITLSNQQIELMKTECKSPCPSHIEMCIEMSA